MATSTTSRTMKAAQVPKAGGAFEIVERELPKPGAGQVRIQVKACGVCHSDVLTKEGGLPGIQYPRVPGHEAAGVIDAPGRTGRRVEAGPARGGRLARRPGQHVSAVPTRRLPQLPQRADRGHQLRRRLRAIHGSSRRGARGAAESLSDTEAAPLLCAGLTTFNALRHSGALPGDLVAVQGIGGLGHLGIQFANKFGYKVAAIGVGPTTPGSPPSSARTLYIDTKTTNGAQALQELGGAQAILATAPSSKAMSELIDGLGPNGTLMVVGAGPDAITVTPWQLIRGSSRIQGWAAGTPPDSEDTLRCAELTGVRPMIETVPFERAAEAYDRMMSGNAQFRVVLTM